MSKTKKDLVRIIFIDIVVLSILSINLIWILFDSLYAYEPVSEFLRNHVPVFFERYNEVHTNFWYYDLFFVIFYFIEIIFQWILSIYKKEYEKWFYYPIMHWYDVLGSIPVGNLRWLRLLRIISIFVRLSKLELIDISRNILFKQLNRLMNIFSEEISDRVVVNILSGVQSEIEAGNPVFEKINTEIILPRKEHLINISSNKIREIIEEFSNRFDNDLKDYVDKRVKLAVDNSNDVRKLARVPVVGNIIQGTLESAISDIVHQIVVDVLGDLKSEQNSVEIKEIIGLFYDGIMAKQDFASTELVKKSLIDSLEIIKDQVKVQQWKVKDLAKRKQGIIANLESFEFDEKIKKLKDLEEIESKMKEAKIKLPLFKVDGEYKFISEGENNG